MIEELNTIRVCENLSPSDADIISEQCANGARSAQDWTVNLINKSNLSTDAKLYIIERRLVSFCMGFMKWITSISADYGIEISETLRSIADDFMATANTKVVVQLVISATEEFWPYVKKRDLQYLGGEALGKEMTLKHPMVDNLLGKGFDLLRAEMRSEGTVKTNHLDNLWKKLDTIVTYCETYKSLMN